MKRSIAHRVFYPHAPKIVWDYLTKAELMEQWLMKSNFELKLGHDFQFNTGPVPALDFDGIVYCKVLEIEPLKKLTYSWKCGPGNGKITIDSIVYWTLLEKDNGTELLLENSGFKEANFNVLIFNAMSKGWLDNMNKMNRAINDAKHGSTHA
jgi:uncharacterized protein YndB with AHSA1/START domain